ncbi:glycosyltransferase family 4 protein [Rhodosalinus sp. 5P4]|uniref:glycosyltransferase family 4 protein n=1 Tax=Rhodosalinus sp. 5P4 TaxID=3239196 RepID=UPI003525BFFD
MRILLLCHYYPPETNAPAARSSEHARHWAAAGHEVTVVTCAPSHPRGRLYPGYRNRLFQQESSEGVRLVRVWSHIAPNAGVSRRAASHLSFALSALAALPRLGRPDVILSTSPQFFCGLAGLPARRMTGARWVFEVRDLWPESILAVNAMTRGRAIRGLEALEARAYRAADHVVPVAEGFVPHIADRRGGAEGITVLRNGVDLAAFHPAAQEDAAGAKARFGLAGRFVATYAGTHGMAHGLDAVLDAAALLRHEPGVGFLLVGDGADQARLAARARAMALPNLRVAGPLPRAEMPSVLAASDASLVLLRDRPAFARVLPSKLAEAMAAAKPVVLGVRGAARAELEAAGAGIAVTRESAKEIAAAVLRLARDPAEAARMGRRGRAHAERHFDRRRIAAEYLSLLEEVAAA